MGHIINPISHRIGYTTFWNSTWSLTKATNSSSYSFISTQELLLNAYLKKLFLYASKKLFGKGLVFIGFKQLRLYNQLILIIDVKLKQLSNLNRGVELSFWNTLGLKNYNNKKTKTSRRPTIAVNKNNDKRLNNYIKPTYRIKPKFIRRTSKLTRYNSSITMPDLWSYTWSLIANTLSLYQRKPVGLSPINNYLKKFPIILKSLLSYVLITRWVSAMKVFIINSLKFFYKERVINLEVMLSILSNNALTATFIAKYLATRLLQKFPLRRLMTLLVRQLKIAYESAIIHGFKIACNGRFERRGRATHTWKICGINPRADVSLQLDYSIVLPVLTNSICAIKVWVTRKNATEKLLFI